MSQINYFELQRIAAEHGLDYNKFCAAFKAYTDPKMLTVPVVDAFDSEKVIGQLSILESEVPTAPNYTFALGFLALEGGTPGAVPNTPPQGAYELKCVSMVSDGKYYEYLKQIGYGSAPVEYSLKGHDRLWNCFGLTYASWLTLPRALMHAMSDDWQNRMGALLEEWADAWEPVDVPQSWVQAKGSDGKFQKWPEWLTNYRYPDTAQIEKMRTKRENA